MIAALVAADAMQGVVGWIIVIPMLILILTAAFTPDDDTQVTPRRSALRRHMWQKLVREEEEEGVRPRRSGRQHESATNRPGPQAKWSSRR